MPFLSFFPSVLPWIGSSEKPQVEELQGIFSELSENDFDMFASFGVGKLCFSGTEPCGNFSFLLAAWGGGGGQVEICALSQLCSTNTQIQALLYTASAASTGTAAQPQGLTH